MDPGFKPVGEGNPLVNVQAGMDVYDREGERVGEVEKVYLGSVDPQEAARAGRPGWRR